MPLHRDFAGAQVAEHVPLARLTTLRVGPLARRVITCVNTEQVVATLGTLDRAGIGALVLGDESGQAALPTLEVRINPCCSVGYTGTLCVVSFVGRMDSGLIKRSFLTVWVCV